MSQAFTNFLGNTGDSNLRDYQHASLLYRSNNYAKTPKLGFLYFVSFSINPSVPLDAAWGNTGKREVGLLVKKIDLPKFQPKTEVVNQYNRKTIIQTGISYQNINIEFHDDNSNLTRDLWTNYYRYYFIDSNYGTGADGQIPNQYKNTKYGQNDYSYGLDSLQVEPFFDSITVYVLHQQNFTQYTLVNPMVTDWVHDSLDQDVANKTLTNKMTTAYENVLYNKGKIVKGSSPDGFAAVYYDSNPSSIAVSGKSNGADTPMGATDVFGTDPGYNQQQETPVDRLTNGTTNIQARPSIGQLNKSGGTISNGALDALQSAGARPGDVNSAINAQLTAPATSDLGNLPINPFSGSNNGVSTTATPIDLGP